MQKLIRGFIGRKRIAKLKFLLKGLSSWCPPEVAVSFIRKHKENQALRLNTDKPLFKSNRFQKERATLIMAEMRRRHEEENSVELVQSNLHVRRFLPPAMQRCALIEIKSAAAAIQA